MAGQHVVYKVVGDLEIKFTITLPENAKNVAILLFLHGFGGLLQGSRDEVPRHVRESVEKYNLALISADYRLAPQANISDIDHDVNDCIDFIRSSEVSQAGRCDPLFLILTIITGSRQAARKPWRRRHHTTRRLW